MEGIVMRIQSADLIMYLELLRRYALYQPAKTDQANPAQPCTRPVFPDLPKGLATPKAGISRPNGLSRYPRMGLYKTLLNRPLHRATKY